MANINCRVESPGYVQPEIEEIGVGIEDNFCQSPGTGTGTVEPGEPFEE